MAVAPYGQLANPVWSNDQLCTTTPGGRLRDRLPPGCAACQPPPVFTYSWRTPLLAWKATPACTGAPVACCVRATASRRIAATCICACLRVAASCVRCQAPMATVALMATIASATSASTSVNALRRGRDLRVRVIEDQLACRHRDLHRGRVAARGGLVVVRAVLVGEDDRAGDVGRAVARHLAQVLARARAGVRRPPHPRVRQEADREGQGRDDAVVLPGRQRRGHRDEARVRAPLERPAGSRERAAGPDDRGGGSGLRGVRE